MVLNWWGFVVAPDPWVVNRLSKNLIQDLFLNLSATIASITPTNIMLCIQIMSLAIWVKTRAKPVVSLLVQIRLLKVHSAQILNQQRLQNFWQSLRRGLGNVSGVCKFWGLPMQCALIKLVTYSTNAASRPTPDFRQIVYLHQPFCQMLQ